MNLIINYLQSYYSSRAFHAHTNRQLMQVKPYHLVETVIKVRFDAALSQLEEFTLKFSTSKPKKKLLQCTEKISSGYSRAKGKDSVCVRVCVCDTLRLTQMNMNVGTGERSGRPDIGVEGGEGRGRAECAK